MSALCYDDYTISGYNDFLFLHWPQINNAVVSHGMKFLSIEGPHKEFKWNENKIYKTLKTLKMIE